MKHGYSKWIINNEVDSEPLLIITIKRDGYQPWATLSNHSYKLSDAEPWVITINHEYQPVIDHDPWSIYQPSTINHS